MKLNSLSACIIGIAAAVVAAICFAGQHATRLALIEERSALQQQLSQMTELIASNDQLSNVLTQATASRPSAQEESREMMRLRGQAAVLRRQVVELEDVRAENRAARAALDGNGRILIPDAAKAVPTADYWPQGSWTFKGYASPEASLQSSLFAANNGDLKEMVAGATGEMQKRLEEDFAAKSETEASAKAIDEVTSIKSVRILDREFQDNETVVVTADMEDRQGETHAARFVMKKIGNDWKIAGLGN